VGGHRREPARCRCAEKDGRDGDFGGVEHPNRIGGLHQRFLALASLGLFVLGLAPYLWRRPSVYEERKRYECVVLEAM